MQFFEAYNKIVELQKKLHSEYATSANFEEVFNQELAQRFNQNFLDQLTKDKQYYLQIFFMNYFKKENKLPFVNPKALLSYNLQKKTEQIPKIFSTSEDDDSNFYETIISLVKANMITSDLKSDQIPESVKTLTDFITYSIIPSLYLMFIEYDSFDLFCKFINSLKESHLNAEINVPIHYTLSRSLFVSPMFIKFIRQTLYQCLKSFHENRFTADSDSVKGSLQKNIMKSFSENLCFIPSYMIIFFKKLNDTSNFLKESLFEPMFDNPENYLIINNPETDFVDNMNDFKAILKSAFTPDFIDEIAGMIDSCSDSEKALFIPKKEGNEQSEVFKKVINSFDKDAFSLIQQLVEPEDNENDNSNDPKIDPIDLFSSQSQREYLLYEALFEDEQYGATSPIYKGTFVGANDCWMFFRKLIKDSPPLPSEYHPINPDDHPPNAKINDREEFFDMIKAILVDTNDPFTNIEANISYNFIVNNFKKADEDIVKSLSKFTKKTSNLVKEHREQAIAMKRMSRFREELESLRIKKVNYIELMNELYKTIITNSIKHPADIPNANADSKLHFEILSDPIKYKHFFQQYLDVQQIQSKKLVGSNCEQVWYHRFFHSLNFLNYCAYRSDLRKLDEIAERAFHKYVEKVSTISFSSNPTVNAIQHIDMFTDKFIDLYQAFECNDDPLTKLTNINNAMDDILSYFKVKFDGDGEDHYQPFRNVILAFVNPPKIISNFVYILEYLMNQKNEFIPSIVLMRIIGSFLSIFQDLKDNTFVHNSLYYYSRSHHCKFDIFITGSSPYAIAKVLYLIINLSKNQILNNQESVDYEKLIEKDPKKVFSIQLKIVDFVNNEKMLTYKGECCAFTTIYFGQNIHFNSNSGAKLKIALYSFKSTKSLFGNLKNKFTSETKDFEQSEGVDDKYIFYENPKDADSLKSANAKVSSLLYLGEKIIDNLKLITKKSD